MQHLTLEQAADFLEVATIEKTIDVGHTLVHTGTDEHGARFILMNDLNGNTTVSVR